MQTEAEPVPGGTGDLNSSGVIFGKTLLQFIPPLWQLDELPGIDGDTAMREPGQAEAFDGDFRRGPSAIAPPHYRLYGESL